MILVYFGRIPYYYLLKGTIGLGGMKGAGDPKPQPRVLKAFVKFAVFQVSGFGAHPPNGRQ